MPQDLLITGFTAFQGFPANPAEAIARRAAAELGARFEPLEVGYDAVEAFVDGLRFDPPACWAMVGVAGGRSTVRVERVARNRFGPAPDVRGLIRGPALISPTLPDALPGTWLPTATVPTGGFELPPCCAWSEDAGDYLCNFVYWLAITRLPLTRSVFVHVAPTDRLPADAQVRAVVSLLGGSTSRTVGGRERPAGHRPAADVG